jgi:PAS domain S-box-containing protein
VLFETLHRREDGSAFPVEVSSRTIQVDKRVYRHSIIRDITERKRAEAAMIENQTRLQLALDSAELGTWELDVEADTITASQRALAIFGFEREEPALEHWTGRIHPADRLRASQALRDAAAGLARYDIEYRIRVPGGGGLRWVMEQGVMIDADERRSGRMIGIVQDITTRKEAERALRESEERFRAAFDHAAIGMVLTSLEGRLTSVNSALCEMLGYTCGELAGKHFQEITHRDDLEAGREAMRALLSGELSRVVFEKRYLRKDGTIVWVQLLSAVLRGGTASAAGFITQVQDITERRRAEEALRESQADLNRAQAVAHTGSWRLDVRRNELLWSTETHRIFGIPEATPLTYELFLACVHPGDRGLVDKSWQAGLQSGAYDIEHRIIVDGRVKWVRERAELELDAEGRLRGGFGTVQDITDRKHAEEEIRRLNAELEQRVRDRTAQLEAANQELEAFAYSVSHDLRAPLRGVDGWSLALLEDYHERLDERGRQYLERVRSETQRMGVLIDDLLQLSRLNRAEMRRVEVDLTRLASQIAARLLEAHPGRRIEFDIEPGLKASGDAGLLEVALTNLLGNAVKFTGKRARAHIEVGKARHNGEPAFYVRDNGAGFDMTYAGRLFGPFQRLHRTSEFQGAGIGLATVQRAIRRHGGRVWAEAQPDRGATFYFVLGDG